MVKNAKEKKLWQDVTPDMMSDEEKIGEKYVRHQPSYRSDSLNKFVTKLDSRGDKKMSAHPRTRRTIGSPRKLCAPTHARKWTVKKDARTPTTCTEGDQGKIEGTSYSTPMTACTSNEFEDTTEADHDSASTQGSTLDTSCSDSEFDLSEDEGAGDSSC